MARVCPTVLRVTDSSWFKNVSDAVMKHAFVITSSLLALLITSLATPALAVDTVTNPFPGGTLKHHVSGTQDLWVLRMDLCAPGVSVRTTGDGERGRTVSSFANLVGAQAAVNGDFFGGGFSTDGPAAHDGGFWGGANHTYVAPISFGPAHVDIPHHNNEGPTPAWAREVISGHPTILDDGQVVGNPGDPLCTNRHPRTAIGITQDHRTLIVLVVDGRRSGAAGFNCDEMAFVLAAEGAFDAVNMDGGGSSTLVVNGDVKNQPSDGSQRTVGNHLAFFASGSGPSPQCPDFVDPTCDGSPNLQRCEGTYITACDEGAPTANGDCGFFGAGCSTEGGSAHCVHPFCLQNLGGGEQGSFCKDDSVIGTCELGVFSEGDCGAFGGLCSEAGGGDSDAHCVHFLCHSNLNGGEDGVFCLDDTTLSTCDLGTYAERECAQGCAENRCSEDAPVPPPPTGEGEGEGEAEGEGEGEEGEGEGEGEGERSDDVNLPPSVGDGGAGCASVPPTILTLTPLLVVLGSKRRRRRRA